MIAPFADRHREMWDWAWSIKRMQPTRPFIAIWPRGGGKSTTAEGVTAALGATGRRRYALYVSETQDQADEHVGNIQALLQNAALEAAYPGMSDPKVNKFGNSKGWRRNRLWTSSGFVVDAMGLDSAKRGAKAEDARPDLIILDDIDGKHDTPGITNRKIKTITSSILPSGSIDVAVLAVQNIVIPTGVFARLANLTDEPADYLADRIISGPHSAVDNLEYEQQPTPSGAQRYAITGGTPTWEGQNLAACQHAIDTQGLTAFLSESQHETERADGMFAHITYHRVDWRELPDLIRVAVWVDPAVTNKDGSDSMGIQADGIAEDGRIYRLYSWEHVTSPLDAIQRAILKAVELGADSVGIETDQGGDTWQSVYREAARALQTGKRLLEGARLPGFKEAKAGAGHGPKVERWARMLSAYERGEITHVRGTHEVLERSLNRVPNSKPYDLTDAAYWAWDDLRNPTPLNINV